VEFATEEATEDVVEDAAEDELDVRDIFLVLSAAATLLTLPLLSSTFTFTVNLGFSSLPLLDATCTRRV
jgi:hypothetical protein